MTDNNNNIDRHPSLWHALAAFQAALPSIRKGQTAQVKTRDGGQGYSYDYADLTDVSEAVLPLLAQYGLAWMTSLDTEEGTLVLRWELAHAGTGDTRTGTLPVGRAGQDWQSIGSAITYARRYALTAATGVAPGGDDNDGRDARAGAQPSKPEQVKQEYLPAGLYDLGALTTAEATRVMFRRARLAGHLPLLVLDADGDAVALGDYLSDLGKRLAVAEAAEKAVADDNGGDDAEAAEAAAVAAHEAAEAGDEEPRA